MLKKDWSSLITHIYAEEADAMGKLLAKLANPAALNPAGIYNLTLAGTEFTIDDFAATERVFSGVAMMDTWYDRTFDFATANGGGPMDAGTYDMYVDAFAVDLGGGQMEYQAWLRAAITGTVDEETYFIIAHSIDWDGLAVTLPSGAAGYMWYNELECGHLVGPLDLTELGKGSWDQVALGAANRGVAIEGATVFRAPPDGVAPIIRLGPQTQIVPYNDGGEQGAFLINLGQGSVVTLGKDSRVDVTGDNAQVAIGSGGGFNVYGYAIVRSGGIWNFQAGSVVLVETPIKFDNTIPAGTPAQHSLYGKNIMRASGLVSVVGGVCTLLDGFNVDSIDYDGVGLYTVHFERDFVDDVYIVHADAISLSKRSVQCTGRWAGSFTLAQHKNEAGDDSQVDGEFGFTVWGGTQAT